MTTLETGVEIPTEAPAVKTRKPRRKAAPVAKADNPAASLIAALKFISIAQKKAGTPNQQFSVLSGNWAAASNEVITVATRIQEDLNACPHTLSLLDALSKCSGELSIVQLSENTLAVSSGDFKGLINCASQGEITINAPDPICAAIDDRVKAALDAVSILATDGAPSATFASVLLQSGTAVATNGHAMLEYWHGVDLPPGLLIPKASAVAIAKAGKQLTGFGFSPSSATFWFEDGSFIKTQLYNERYPNYKIVIEPESMNAWPLPEQFFKGVKAIESFSENSIVYFKDGILLSNAQTDKASTYKIEGLPDDLAFNAKYLIMMQDFMQKVHFEVTAMGPKAYFHGTNVRGVLMGVKLTKQEASEFTDDFPF